MNECKPHDDRGCDGDVRAVIANDYTDHHADQCRSERLASKGGYKKSGDHAYGDESVMHG